MGADYGPLRKSAPKIRSGVEVPCGDPCSTDHRTGRSLGERHAGYPRRVPKVLLRSPGAMLPSGHNPSILRICRLQSVNLVEISHGAGAWSTRIAARSARARG